MQSGNDGHWPGLRARLTTERLVCTCYARWTCAVCLMRRQLCKVLCNLSS